MLCANCHTSGCKETLITCVDEGGNVVSQTQLTHRPVAFIEKTPDGMVCSLADELDPNDIPTIIQGLMEQISLQVDDPMILAKALMGGNQ